MDATHLRLYNRALRVAQFILYYNIAEGIVSVWLGYSDRNLTLLGFGLDSFIEVASNLGVIIMIKRIKHHPDSDRTPFEKTALRVTGYSFYLLTLGLVITASYNVWHKQYPVETVWSIVISLVSIACMWTVARLQLKTGKALQSQPIIADARCTLVCIYMSVIVLLSGFIYKVSGFIYTDALGACLLGYYAWREGRESLASAQGMECHCNT